MCKASPEQRSVAESFHIRQNRRSRSRDTGSHLEDSIHKTRNLSGEDKGDRSVKADEYPGKSYRHVAFLLVDLHVDRFSPGQNISRHDGQKSKRQINQTLTITIDQRNETGHKHQ